MPNAVSTLTNINGYTTPIGNRALGIRKFGWNTGNYVSAAAAGCMKVYANAFGLRGFDNIQAGITALGNYIVECQIAAPGAASASVRLYVATTGAEVANGAALTADSVTIMAIGG